MKTILVCGHILSEIQFFVEKIALENAVAVSDSIHTLTSSKVINAARVMSEKNKIIYYGFVGKDLEGQKAVEDLKKYGFDTSLTMISEGEKTGKVIVATNKDGLNAMYLFHGANVDLNINDIPGKLFEEVDAIYTNTSVPLAFEYDLIEKANENKIPIFLDVPNRHKEFNKNKVHKIDYFMPNRFEAAALTDMPINAIDDATKVCFKLRDFIDGNILITLDKDGVVFLHKDKQEVSHFPGEILQPLDSTGAGDVFRGVLTSEVINGTAISEAIKKANKLASLSVLMKGVDEKVTKTKISIKNDVSIN